MGKCKCFYRFLKVAPKCVLGGHILKLSDKVAMTRAFTAIKNNRLVIVFLRRVSQIPFLKKYIQFLKNTSVVLLCLYIVF